MKSGLNFPYDALQELSRFVVVRIALLLPCILVGLALGTFFRVGSEFTFERAFSLLPWLTVAWMFSISTLVAVVATLVVLVVVLGWESKPSLPFAVLTAAWACAGYACA